MQRLGFGVLAALIGLMVFNTQPAFAGKKEDIAALQLQLGKLQEQLDILSQRTGQTDADATLQISQLQRENQALTGQVEKLSNELRKMQARLDQVTRVLAGETFSGIGGTSPNSVGQLTGGVPSEGGTGGIGGSALGATSGSTGPVTTESVTTGPTTLPADSTTGNAGGAPASAADGVTLPGDPNAAYNYASAFLLSGDYLKARRAFEMYIENFPNSPQTPDARFRLGEIYLATGANGDAAQTFIGHIRDYPNDPKAAEAHLKLGTAFARLQQADQACQIFAQVRIKYPNASQIVQSRTDLEIQRLGCS